LSEHTVPLTVSHLIPNVPIDLVPLRDVAYWQAFLNVAATIGRSLGGPVGGWLADTIGWRWSFFGQTPFFLIAILLGWIFLPGRQHRVERRDELKALSRVDFLGTFLLAALILTFLLPLEIGGVKVPWTHPLIFSLLGTSVVLVVLFGITEEYWAKDPIFPLLLLKHKDVVLSYLIMGLQVAAQLGLMFSVPLYFQVTERASNTVAGAHLFPAVAGNAVGGIMSGVLIKKYVISPPYPHIFLLTA
jgi:MFS family permease